jgi:hypothetical protein
MRITSFLFLFLISWNYILTADHYVRQSATGNGNGNDWTNAFTSLPQTLIRGDTYYIADGNYSQYTFDDAASGTDTIWVLKATASAHGTETGWSSSYGDGQAIFDTRFIFTTPYYYIDGVVGGGLGSYEDTTSYGFKVQYTGSSSGIKNVRFYDTAHHIYYAHTDHVYTANRESDVTTATDQDSWFSAGGSYITTAYCSFRYAGRVHVITHTCTYLTFEYCYFYYNKTCASQHAASHADAGSDNIILRYNLYRKNKGTAIIDILSRGSFQVTDNWEIYGNVFWGGERSGYDCTDGVIVVINGQEANGWKVYNNSFFNLIGVGTDTGVDWSEGTYTTGGHQVYNNLFYNCENPVTKWSPGDESSVSDYHYYIDNSYTPSESNRQVGSGDPFTDWANYDFSLTRGTNDGNSLSSPYNVDAAGNTRGEDGTWDRGAYEYNAGNGSLPEKPQGVNITPEDTLE